MTTEATEKTAIDLAAEKLADLEAKLTAAHAEAEPKMAAIMAVKPLNIPAMIEAGRPAEKLEIQRDAAKIALAEAKASDAWEKVATIRQPALDAIHALIVQGNVTAPLSRMSGKLEIKDGAAAVSLVPTFGEADIATIAAAIAETVDVKEYVANGFVNIDLSVDLTAKPPVWGLKPASASTSKPKAASTGNGAGGKGRKEFLFEGKWLASRAFLEAVRASGNAVVNDHADALVNVLDNKGNGMSNLADSIAAKLKSEMRQS
jgi:hypothetical protein